MNFLKIIFENDFLKIIFEKEVYESVRQECSSSEIFERNVQEYSSRVFIE